MNILQIKNPYIGVYLASAQSHLKVYPTVDLIKMMVCEVLRVKQETLLDHNRKPDDVLARQLCWFLVKQYLQGMTSVKLGELFDRDHSTVLYGIAVITDRLAVEKDLQDTYNKIQTKIKLYSNL